MDARITVSSSADHSDAVALGPDVVDGVRYLRLVVRSDTVPEGQVAWTFDGVTLGVSEQWSPWVHEERVFGGFAELGGAVRFDGEAHSIVATHAGATVTGTTAAPVVEVEPPPHDDVALLQGLGAEPATLDLVARFRAGELVDVDQVSAAIDEIGRLAAVDLDLPVLVQVAELAANLRLSVSAVREQRQKLRDAVVGGRSG